MRRFSHWCASVLAVIVLSGCSRRETLVQSGGHTQIFQMFVRRDPGTLDPHVAGSEVGPILNALYEGLVTLSNDGATVLPGVAERWDVSDNGRTYTFHLRPTAHWSNGDPVTAQAFMDSFLRFLDPRLRSPYANDIFMIAGAKDYAEGRNPDPASVGITAVDTQTLVIQLAHRSPYFLVRLTEREVRPVHLPSVDRFGGRHQRGTGWDKPGNLVSNGPFMLTEWKQDHIVTVVKNPHYWDAARVKLNEIRFFPIDDAPTAERAYRTGQLHVSPVPPSKRAAYREQSSAELHSTMQLGTRYLRFRTNGATFHDARVRRALSLAIDREKIVSGVLAGFGVASHSMAAPGAGGYQAPKSFASVPVEARRLLADAGYPNGQGFPPAELLVSGKDGETIVLAEALCEMWHRELGLEIKIRSNEGTAFLDSIRSGNFEVCLSNWPYDINDPVEAYLLGVSTYPSNQSGWASAEFDRAFVESEEAPNDEARRKAFDAMEAMFAADMPFVPIFHGANTVLVSPSVRGWRDNGLGYIDWRELSLAPAK